MAQQTIPDDEHLIVSGERIGRIKLGANAADFIDDFLRRHGTCEAGHSHSGPEFKVVPVYCISMDAREVIGALVTPECEVARALSKGSTTTVIGQSPQCRILEAFTLRSNYATGEGLHVGVLEKQVRDVLGEPNRTIAGKDGHSLLYASGISFTVDEKLVDNYQKVTGIWVRPRNCLEVVQNFQADYPCH